MLLPIPTEDGRLKAKEILVQQSALLLKKKQLILQELFHETNDLSWLYIERTDRSGLKIRTVMILSHHKVNYYFGRALEI